VSFDSGTHLMNDICLVVFNATESEVDFDKKRLNMFLSTHNPYPSTHAITLKYLTSLPSTQLFVIFGGYIFQQRVGKLEFVYFLHYTTGDEYVTEETDIPANLILYKLF
jgi:hypothetical protein